MTARPSGTPPPRTAAGQDGTHVDLVALAEEVATRHLDAYPDEIDRYGDAGREWCVHDHQHLLNWALIDAHTGLVDLGEQVQWLARVLRTRGYPVERLARSLETAAVVVRERLGDESAAGRLTVVARSVA